MKKKRTELVVAAGVLAFALVAYGQYGVHGRLIRDDALYVYAGQQLAQGVSPYRAVFEHKGPLAAVLAGAAVIVGRAAGVDDVVAARLLFGLLSALTVSALYRLAADLFRSRGAGLVAAALFLCFWGFGRHALSGPNAKTPAVLFEVLTLLATVRGRFVSAGLAGGLAGLVWQPAGVYALVALIVAFAQARALRAGLLAAGRALLGSATPLAVASLWLALDGSFGDFVDGAIRYNALYAGGGPATLAERFSRPLAAVTAGYPHAAIPIGLGLLAVLFGYAWRAREAGRAIVRDPFAAVLASFPAPVLWSLLDFQEYPDFYVLLPYAALGFAGLAQVVLARVRARLRARSVEPLAAALAAAFALAALLLYRATSESGLLRQREQARALAALVGPGAHVATLGVPQVLVLLRETNPTRHVILFPGTDAWIEAHEPGGFDGWLAELERAAPAAVAVGAVYVRREALGAWLEARHRPERIGDWLVFVRNGGT